MTIEQKKVKRLWGISLNFVMTTYIIPTSFMTTYIGLILSRFIQEDLCGSYPEHLPFAVFELVPVTFRMTLYKVQALYFARFCIFGKSDGETCKDSSLPFG